MLLWIKFHHNSAIHDEVGSKPILQPYGAVDQRNRFLLFYAQTNFSQFKGEARLIRGL